MEIPPFVLVLVKGSPDELPLTGKINARSHPLAETFTEQRYRLHSNGTYNLCLKKYR